LLRTFFKIALVDADLHKSGLNLGMEKQEREPHTIQPQIRLREKLAHLSIKVQSHVDLCVALIEIWLSPDIADSTIVGYFVKTKAFQVEVKIDI
jgi:hypothetical protein